MEGLIEFLKNYPEVVYALSVCCITFVILKYLICNPTKKQKFVILFSTGFILGVLFWITSPCNFPLMVLGFAASIGFYELGIKLIMKKLGTSYCDKVE